jgi:VWFA-related protein
MKKTFVLAVLSGILLFAALPPGTAARGQDIVRPQKPLEYQVAVTLKLIQAYVTDRKGRPVEDLTKDDFVITDDGNPVAITEFERHALPPLAGRTGAPASASASGTTATPAALNRKFLLFFDFAFNNQRGIVKAKEAALHFVDTELAPEDAVAVISYSAIGGLVIHEFFTTDHAKVREAVQAVNGQKIAGRAEDIEEQYWRQAAEGVPVFVHTEHEELVPPQLKMPPIYNWRRQESKNIAENYILKLTALATSLRYIPGQKNIIFFTTGIAASLIYGNQEGSPNETTLIYGGRPVRAVFDPGDHIVRTLNEAMLKEMTSADCVISAFDTREASLVPSLFSYDERTFEEYNRDVFYDEGVNQTVTNPLKNDKVTGLDSLKRFASATGGKYYSNILDYKRTLDEVRTATGAFYVLGYPIPRVTDGRFHALKIEVKRKGCAVRAQSGYFDPKPYAEYSDLEKQLQLFDLALNDHPVYEIPVSFPMSALAYPSGVEGRLELVARLPVAVIDKFAEKPVEIIALVFDGKDNVVRLVRREASLRRYAGMDLYVAFGTPLPPGSYKGRMVLRDLESGTSARASVPITAKAKPMTGLALASPLLLWPKSHFIYLESEAEKRDAAASPWKRVYAYERSLYSPLVGPVGRETPTIYAVLPCSIIGLVEPDLTLGASLINGETGARITVPASILKRTVVGDGEVEWVELSVEGVEPGRYVLYFFVRDAKSQAAAFVQTGLIIS